jgi:tetratricopeptide (TPR) repeat protein
MQALSSFFLAFLAINFGLLADPQIPDPKTTRLEEVARRSPGSARAWRELGLAHAARRRLEPAREAFAKACNLAPDDEDACYYLGRTLFTLGRYDQALGPFQKALRAAPSVRVHRAVALNFVALTRPQDAERHFREAVRLNPNPERAEDDARIDYGAFLFRQGRMTEALSLLEPPVEAFPMFARAHLELGRVLLHLGRREAAAARLEKAVELDPASSTARLLLGRAYLELGRTEEGQKQLRLGQEAWKKGYGSSTLK